MDLSKIRRKLAESLGEIDFQKQHVNTAVQSIDDNFNAVKLQWSQDIDTATQALSPPYTFSNAQKKILFPCWLLGKYGDEIL